MSKTAQRKRNSKQFMQGFYQEGYKLGLEGLPIGTGKGSTINKTTNNYEQLGHKHGLKQNLKQREKLEEAREPEEKARGENHEEVN